MRSEPRSIERLLAWKVPDCRHAFSRRDTAFYALSIGAGRDPDDDRNHRQVDPWAADLVALPSMALVLGYPGFWLGSPDVARDCGFVASKVLHVEQSVELAGPLPVEDAVIGETCVTGIVDKGPDKGSLLLSERRIRSADSGALLATCRQIHFLRGFGGFGSYGSALPDKLPESAGSPENTVQTLVRAEQAMIYRLNGDANPIHSSAGAAKSAGFPRPILHGMCTVGMAVHAVIQTLRKGDAEGVRSFTTRMLAPVFPGDTLQSDIWANGSFRVSVASRQSTVLEGRVQ